MSLEVSGAICALVSEAKSNRTRGGRASFCGQPLLRSIYSVFGYNARCAEGL
jgi:hypothetical protein